MPSPHRLSRSFFNRDTLIIARELLGQRLVRLDKGNVRLSGLIIEAEAYIGTDDLGCHARVGRTPRNESMWGPPGHAYVYFTYGMHWMLNFVTERDGFPAAVLIRALIPLEGRQIMRRRRGGPSRKALTDGPAKICQALSIDRALNGCDLCQPSSPLFVEAQSRITDSYVTTGPRIGLNNVPEPWKSIPWRFRIQPEHITECTEKTTREEQ